MKELKPFGDVPKKLSVQVKRSFVATRTFTQALNVGRDIIAKMQSVIRTKECNSPSSSVCVCFFSSVEMITVQIRRTRCVIKLVKPEIWTIPFFNDSRFFFFYLFIFLFVCLSLKFFLIDLYLNEQLEASGDCMRAVMRMSMCPVCQGLGEVKPCGHYCLNVFKGCLAYHADLGVEWDNYVGTFL